MLVFLEPFFWDCLAMFMSYFHHLHIAGDFQTCVYTLHFLDQEKQMIFQVFHSIWGCNITFLIGTGKIRSRKIMLREYLLVHYQSVTKILQVLSSVPFTLLSLIVFQYLILLDLYYYRTWAISEEYSIYSTCSTKCTTSCPCQQSFWEIPSLANLKACRWGRALEEWKTVKADSYKVSKLWDIYNTIQIYVVFLKQDVLSEWAW